MVEKEPIENILSYIECDLLDYNERHCLNERRLSVNQSEWFRRIREELAEKDKEISCLKAYLNGLSKTLAEKDDEIECFKAELEKHLSDEEAVVLCADVECPDKPCDDCDYLVYYCSKKKDEQMKSDAMILMREIDRFHNRPWIKEISCHADGDYYHIYLKVKELNQKILDSIVDIEYELQQKYRTIRFELVPIKKDQEIREEATPKPSEKPKEG